MTSSSMPPPPSYAPSPLERPSPRHLGTASGCTIAAGVLFSLVGVLAIMGTLLFSAVLSQEVPRALHQSITMVVVVTALIPLAAGVVAIMAGAQLKRGHPPAYGLAFGVNVVSLVLSAMALTVMGLGLITGALSGAALWALSQPDVKAFFGR